MCDGNSMSYCVVWPWIPHCTVSSMGFNLKGFLSTSQTDMYLFSIFQLNMQMCCKIYMCKPNNSTKSRHTFTCTGTVYFHTSNKLATSQTLLYRYKQKINLSCLKVKDLVSAHQSLQRGEHLQALEEEEAHALCGVQLSPLSLVPQRTSSEQRETFQRTIVNREEFQPTEFSNWPCSVCSFRNGSVCQMPGSQIRTAVSQ